MSGLLLDASVWVAARNADEAFHAASCSLIDGDATLFALDLTLYEVANVALVKWRSAGWARDLIGLVLATTERRIAVDETLLDRAVDLADRHGLTAYDAAYVAAAQAEGLTLVSADLRDLVRPGLAVAPDAVG